MYDPTRGSLDLPSSTENGSTLKLRQVPQCEETPSVQVFGHRLGRLHVVHVMALLLQVSRAFASISGTTAHLL
jgi:hypothetical protein